MTDRMALRRPRLVHVEEAKGRSFGADRKALLAKVHVARKQLALTEDSYRDVMRRVIGVDSAAEATAAQLDTLLGEFRRLGFKPSRGRPDHRAQARMILGIWRDLAPYRTAITEAEDREALRQFVRRQTKGQAEEVRFLDEAQRVQVLEGLKSWLARERRKEAGHAA